MSTPAFVTKFVRAERFLAIVDDRRDRFEGYQELVWSLELLLRDVLRDTAGAFDPEGWSLSKLVQTAGDKADLPAPLQRCLGELVSHRNIFFHALKWQDLDGRTYSDDLDCVKGVALWYLRDFRRGPRMGVELAERLLAGEQPSASPSWHVFLSYAVEDKARAQELYRRLKARGHQPWMDKHELLPGQYFEIEIRRAIERADFFIALMSRSSVTKRGFVQKEIRFALDVLGQIPPGRIYFVPVRLEECEVPDAVRQLHWIDLQDEESYGRLWRAIEKPPS